MSDGRLLQLIGTFLPVIGVFATIIVAGVTAGWKRWSALTLIPAITLAIMVFGGGDIARDGNMLFALLFILFVLAVLVYYPILFVVGLRKLMSARAAELSETSPADEAST